MKRTFNNARFGPAPDIATRAELDKRLAERAKPAVQRHLVPGGIQTTIVNRSVIQQNETRIQQLRGRLANAKNGLEREFSVKPQHGRAKTDFGRSR